MLIETVAWPFVSWQLLSHTMPVLLVELTPLPSCEPRSGGNAP